MNTIKMAAEVRNFKTEVKFENLGHEDEEMDTAEHLEEGEISSDDDHDLAPLAEVEASLFDGQKNEASKRFTLVGDMTLAVPKEELNELYESLGIDHENERHYRFNTVHLRGTENMETEDLIEYFSGLDPVAVDWLGPGVCNVQWDDEILPARALLYLSVEIKNIEKRFKLESGIIDSESEDEVELTGNVVDACKLKFMIPPGRWRKGISCDLSKNIIMRYANKDDKPISKSRHRHHHSRQEHRSHHGKKPKQEETYVEDAPKDPWGHLAQSWGRGEGLEKHIWSTAPPRDVPDLRSSLNNVVESRFADIYLRRAAELRWDKPPSPPVFFQSSDESDNFDDDDVVRRRKLPKMHADREEQKQKLARIEAVAKLGDLRSRLNHRKAKAAPPERAPLRRPVHSDESGDDLSTGWASENYHDLKRTLVNRERSPPDDSLESDSDLEFGADEPGEMLQIEVDNEYYEDKDHQHRRRRKH